MSDANKAEIMPTHKQELTLRTIEVYETLLDRYNTKQIGLKELVIGIRTLVEACGWGIEKDTFLMLSEPVGDSIVHKPVMLKTILAGTDGEKVFIAIIAIDRRAHVVTWRKIIYKSGSTERIVKDPSVIKFEHVLEVKKRKELSEDKYREIIEFAVSDRGNIKYEVISVGKL